MVQEHSATRLHWDLRLERDGVAVSWAVPNGIPEVPGENRMAVHTEDHPLEYLAWEGVIPKGNYGAGTMKVWDHGTYETHEWSDTKATVTFHGEQVKGRYHLFHIGGRGGNDWMIRRVDPPLDPGRQPIPERVAPAIALPGELPAGDDGYAFEVLWGGRRVLAFCEPGRMRLEDAAGEDVTALYPELGRLTRSVGAHTVVLDGELVALGDDGKPDPQRLARRAKPGSDSVLRRRGRDIPVVFELYDVVFLDGHSLAGLPWRERRACLHELELDGEHWHVSQYHQGDGAALLEAARANGLPGVVAKALADPYGPGWIEIPAEGSDAARYYKDLAPVLLPHLAGRRVLRDGNAVGVIDLDNFPTVRFATADPDVALLLHGMLTELGLPASAKTDGSGGLEVWLPLAADTAAEQAQAFAGQVAGAIASAGHGERLEVVGARPVLAPYSLAGDGAQVSAPLGWDEVAAGALDFGPDEVVARVRERGDLFAGALSPGPRLPR